LQSENGFQLSTLKWPSDKFFLLRLHSGCAPMYGKCRLLSKNFWIKSAYDVTHSRSMTSYADSIYLWKVHDIFRALEPIESKQPFYTTLPSTIRGVYTTLPSTIKGVYTTLPSTIRGVYTTLPSTIRYIQPCPLLLGGYIQPCPLLLEGYIQPCPLLLGGYIQRYSRNYFLISYMVK